MMASAEISVPKVVKMSVSSSSTPDVSTSASINTDATTAEQKKKNIKLGGRTIFSASENGAKNLLIG